MRCDDQQSVLLERNAVEPRVSHLEGFREKLVQRIDDGVAGDDDPFRGDVLASQFIPRERRRREVEGGEHGGQATIHFFREGIARIVAAQAGFDVADRDVAMKRRHRRCADGRGVTLDHQQIGLHLAQGRIHRRQYARGEFGQRLVLPHQV